MGKDVADVLLWPEAVVVIQVPGIEACGGRATVEKVRLHGHTHAHASGNGQNQ